jgi:hypothetical protein
VLLDLIADSLRFKSASHLPTGDANPTIAPQKEKARCGASPQKARDNVAGAELS